MAAAIEARREAIESGLTCEELRALLPPGGARNALDCALWELSRAVPPCQSGNWPGSRGPAHYSRRLPLAPMSRKLWLLAPRPIPKRGRLNLS